MAYTRRQQHCLEAMGIVPWVSRWTETPLSLGPKSVTVARGVPSDLNLLASWLPQQALAIFGQPGTEHTLLGHPEAPLLVIVEQRPDMLGQLPLSGEAAQLFELMMRAINQGRGEVCQCALALSPGSADTVDTACTPYRRAGLLLLHSLDDDLEAESAEQHHFRLSGSQLPVWRIPHPDVLLRAPHRKRQAWQALKVLQKTLTGA